LRYVLAVLSRSRHSRQRSKRGFTLIELLAVVVITAILSLLAVAGFRRHMQSARGGEALSVIQAIRSAEESYMAENKIYLNVSASKGVNWYPQLAPGPKRSAFSASSHPDYTLWRQLAPSVNGSVMFGFMVNAGVPGTVIPALQVANAPAMPAAQPLDWYVIQAIGDVDGDNVFSRYASTKMTGEVYVENEGE
jgi:prepilin-type N-terminal cleavage/methylation domain-containing protein